EDAHSLLPVDDWPHINLPENWCGFKDRREASGRPAPAEMASNPALDAVAGLMMSQACRADDLDYCFRGSRPHVVQADEFLLARGGQGRTIRKKLQGIDEGGRRANLEFLRVAMKAPDADPTAATAPGRGIAVR